MNKIKAHVICCNDMVEFVVIGSKQKAEVKLEELETEHFMRNRLTYRDHRAYRSIWYWNIHTVDWED